MTIAAALFASNRQSWETPWELFNRLNRRHGFTIDLASDDANKRVARNFTRADNALEQSWKGETGWLNPPYSQEEDTDGLTVEEDWNKPAGVWVKKCYDETRDPGTTVVALLPARTDTAWFHDWVYKKAVVKFLRGRLRFEYCGQPGPHAAPFPSMIVIWK